MMEESAEDKGKNEMDFLDSFVPEIFETGANQLTPLGGNQSSEDSNLVNETSAVGCCFVQSP
jgi:hypothetical protein